MKPKKMVIHILGNRDDIKKLTNRSRFIHLTFRPSNMDILNIINTCTKLEFIELSQSHIKSLSATTKTIFKQNNIKIIEGDMWGRRNDIHDDITISQDEMIEICKMVNQNQPKDHIGEYIRSIEPSFKQNLIDYIIERCSM